jgi:uncharacterized membrane protein YqaE (UPF0057 family)
VAAVVVTNGTQLVVLFDFKNGILGLLSYDFEMKFDLGASGKFVFFFFLVMILGLSVWLGNRRCLVHLLFTILGFIINILHVCAFVADVFDDFAPNLCFLV